MRYVATYGPGSGSHSPAFNGPPGRRLYAAGVMEQEVRAAERSPLPVGGFNFGRADRRNVEPEPYIGQKYDRGQFLTALAGTGAVLGLIGVFAGKPDGIDLTVTGGAAIVELQDRLGLNGIRYLIPANGTLETLVSRERVTAFNVADGSPATVAATGKWAALAPAVEGYVHGRSDDYEVGELGLTQRPDVPQAGEAAY